MSALGRQPPSRLIPVGIHRLSACFTAVCALLTIEPPTLGQERSVQRLGRASCGSSTCHGGLVGHGPAWNSSLRKWEAYDRYHVAAGAILREDRSIQMIARLLGKQVSQTEIDSLMVHRCVGCHAPSYSEEMPVEPVDRGAVDRAMLDASLRNGVSCEDCHGGATRWLSKHTRQDFVSTDGQAAQLGMFPTKNWDARVQRCATCHLGERSNKGPIRDVDHDLIAAGHPALHFDMARLSMALPIHWDTPGNDIPTVLTEQRVGVTYESPSPKQVTSADSMALQTAVRLAQGRRAVLGTTSPLSEFSEWRCSGCHHSMRPPGEGNSLLDWNPHYFQSTTKMLPPALDSLKGADWIEQIGAKIELHTEAPESLDFTNEGRRSSRVESSSNVEARSRIARLAVDLLHQQSTLRQAEFSEGIKRLRELESRINPRMHDASFTTWGELGETERTEFMRRVHQIELLLGTNQVLAEPKEGLR